MKTVDVLIKAREYIVSGWGQGAYCNRADEKDEKDCYCCALGAIGMATPGCYPNVRASKKYPENTPAARYLNQVVSPDRLGMCIAAWNDAPCRTLDEVLKAFDKAIANAKRRHINGGRVAARAAK